MDLESSSLFIYCLFDEADNNSGWRWRIGWLMNDILQRKRNKTVMDKWLCTYVLIYYGRQLPAGTEENHLINVQK
jgi:hypothetical protein